MTAYIAPGLMDYDEIIARHYHTTVENMHRPTRQEESVEPRQVAIYYKVKHLGMRPSHVSRMYPGNKDSAHMNHSTVQHCVKTVEQRMETDKLYRKKVQTAILLCDRMRKKSGEIGE